MKKIMFVAVILVVMLSGRPVHAQERPTCGPPPTTGPCDVDPGLGPLGPVDPPVTGIPNATASRPPGVDEVAPTSTSTTDSNAATVGLLAGATVVVAAGVGGAVVVHRRRKTA